MMHNSPIRARTCICKYSVKTLEMPIFRLLPIQFLLSLKVYNGSQEKEKGNGVAVAKISYMKN